MNFTETEQGNAVIFSIHGSLDSTTSPAFEHHLVERMDAGSNKLILDFADLDYISSAGLRVLLMIARRLKVDESGLAICCLRKQVYDVLEISGFLPILTVVDSVDTAIAAVNQ